MEAPRRNHVQDELRIELKYTRQAFGFMNNSNNIINTHS